MVRKDLSAVVDVQLPGMDAHDSDNGGDDSDGAILWIINVTGYRQLMRSLAAYQLANGTNVLSGTTLFLSSDFDRLPYLSQVTYGANAGNGHGPTVSALLTGGLVCGGRVVGDTANWTNSGGSVLRDRHALTHESHHGAGLDQQRDSHPKSGGLPDDAGDLRV